MSDLTKTPTKDSDEESWNTPFSELLGRLGPPPFTIPSPGPVTTIIITDHGNIIIEKDPNQTIKKTKPKTKSKPTTKKK